MASREENEAVAGLLRRSLARDAHATGDCPEPELLAGYFEHSLDADEAARYDRHFSSCARCREQLAAMVRAEPPKPQPRSAWLLDWRLLTAAAAVMVLVTVWVARRPDKVATVSPANPPLVAMSKDQPKPEFAPKPEADEIKPAPSRAPDAAKRTRLALPSPASPLASTDAKSDQLDNERISEAYAQSNSLEVQSAARPKASANQMKARNPAQAAPSTQQSSATGTGGGIGAGGQKTQFGHAAAAQQQQQGGQQQLPQASQMVMVEPAPPSSKNPSGAPQSAAAGAREAAAPATVPSSVTETVQVSAAQAETAPNADISKKSQQASQPVSSAFVVSDGAASLQILAERSVAKVIDTPIPSVKWRITAEGFVERSEDGGATWKGQEPDPEAHLVDGSAPTEKVCWLVGREGVVLVTKDATNWKKIPPPVAADITAVSAKNASDATVTTADGRRFSTHNEGKKWKPEN